MQCDCINRLPEMAKQDLEERGRFKKPIERCEFDNVTWSVSRDDLEMRTTMKSDLLIHLEGQRTPKKMPFFYTYCPFCGTRIREEAKTEATNA